MLVYTLSFIDRKIPFILLEDIRHDLALSDTQLGLLTGLAFTLVYAITALPISRFSDIGVRKNIIALAIAFWSVLTALGGLAANFWQLALARAGVAVGEAACTPAAHSMLADLFPARQRSSALALYMVGAPLGILLGMSLGALVASMSSWRVAMVAVGLPGLILSAIVFFAIREPPRRAAAPAAGAAGIGEALRTVAASPVLCHIMISGALMAAAGGASNAFAPSFMIRSFQLSTLQTGVMFGAVAGCAGIIGSLVGGFSGDYLRRRKAHHALWFVAGALGISGPLLVLSFNTGGLETFLALQFVSLLLSITYAGPCFATVQGLTPSRMHALVTAIYLFALNGLGTSLGPLLAGAISDQARSTHGDNSLGFGLTIVAFAKVWAAVHLVIAGFKLRKIVTEGSPS